MLYQVVLEVICQINVEVATLEPFECGVVMRVHVNQGVIA
jgi:hypothetical protein